MKVTYKKVINDNKDNRVEFWINHFDYEDGNDYLAALFNKEFNMIVEEKKDYIYFSIIKIHIDNVYQTVDKVRGYAPDFSMSKQPNPLIFTGFSACLVV